MEKIGVRSVLSYWRSYFDPGGQVELANCSTGLIAAHLHKLLRAWGSIDYYDSQERPRGLDADLFVGHFWAFASVCQANSFATKVAVYVLSDPDRARRLLAREATRHTVPMPDWDLPPVDFDHETTMKLADQVLLVGNQHTLATFPKRWHPKISLVNYAVDEQLWARPMRVDRKPSFVYLATHCGLRKGFVDTLATWREIGPSEAQLHVVGHLDSPYDRLLAECNTGSITAHGWIDSASDRYLRLLRSCRFAYLPTWVEGQMGTLLEALAAGCIPLTTRASGVDEAVLAHCVVIEPRNPAQHREAIRWVLTWPPAECDTRSRQLRQATRTHHTWTVFAEQVSAAVAPLLGGAAANPARRRA